MSLVENIESGRIEPVPSLKPTSVQPPQEVSPFTSEFSGTIDEDYRYASWITGFLKIDSGTVGFMNSTGFYRPRSPAFDENCGSLKSSRSPNAI